MAEYTRIKLPHTVANATALPSTWNNIQWQANNAGLLGTCEPWIHSLNKQLWVGSVCINPKITVSAGTRSGITVVDIPNQEIFAASDVAINNSTNEVFQKLVLNVTDLMDYMGTVIQPFTIMAGSSVSVYNPFVTYTAGSYGLTIGNNLRFTENDPVNSTQINRLDADYIYSVETIKGSSITPIGSETYNATGDYLKIQSYFDSVHYCLLPKYLSGNLIGVNEAQSGIYTVDHLAVTTTPTTSSPAQLAHGGTFQAITSVTADTSGHITGFNTATYTLPSDSGSGGVSVAQTLTASLGTPIGATSESYSVDINLSDDSTPVTLSHDPIDSVSGNGTDVRFGVSNGSSRDEIRIRFAVIDGGEIQ